MTPPRPRSSIAGQKRVRERDERGDVQLDLLALAFGRDRLETPVRPEAGVIHQQFDAHPQARGFGRDLLGHGGLGQVGRDDLDADAGVFGAQSGRKFLQTFAPARRHDQIVAAFGQGLREAEPDAARCTRDQRHRA